ncbi:MAG: site-2 protease family protein [Oscillospiraceae bacterium]|jgi:regulator of sigma E protease|nr:site-2 protease family protein [Oscillospiraceae bacterium]
MNILLIIFAIILFNLIVFVHEFGHFFTAKSFGVKVNEFAIGMGPKILKFQRGETLYSLRLFPIGGFCSMEGEDEESDDKGAFGKRKPWQRIIIVAAGAIMNIVLGIIISFILSVQQPKFASTTISDFLDNAVSSQHGLLIGDQIDSINGFSTKTYKDMNFAIKTSKENTFSVQVTRKGQKVTLENVQFLSTANENGSITIQQDFHVEPIEKNFGTIIKQSFLDALSTVKMTLAGLVGIISGKFSLSNMAGPIGIASLIGEATYEGLKVDALYALNQIISIMAMITINLGVVNLLPLPALDGGRLVFFFFELIFKKKLNPKYEGWVHAAGFVVLIALMLFITFGDIIRLIPR